jgi:DNA-binding transcriptional ArsR family regulator
MGKIKHNRDESDDFEAAAMFHALGDATRLRIFNLLRVRANQAKATPAPPVCYCDDESCESGVREAGEEAESSMVADAINTVNIDSELPVPAKKAKAKADKSADKSGKGAKKIDELPMGAVTVGEICQFLSGEKKFTSVVSHHLKELRHAGLITVERSGKMKLCRVNHEAAEALCNYLCTPTLPEPTPGEQN